MTALNPTSYSKTGFTGYTLCFIFLWYCDHLVGEQGAGCFSIRSVACVVFLVVCLVFLLVSWCAIIYDYSCSRASILIEPAHDKHSIILLRPAKTQISLRFRASYQSSLIACAFYILQVLQRGINENPCHTGLMCRLIWVFPGYTGHIVDFAIHWLIFDVLRINMKILTKSHNQRTQRSQGTEFCLNDIKTPWWHFIQNENTALKRSY